MEQLEPEVPQEDIPSGAVEVIAKIGRKNNPTQPVADDYTIEGGPQRVNSVAEAYGFQGTEYWKEGVGFYVSNDSPAPDGYPERGTWRVIYGQLLRESFGFPVRPGGGDGAIQFNAGGEFAGDETALGFRWPGFLGTGAALPADSRYYDEYRSGLFIPGNFYDEQRAWGIFGPNGYPLQSYEYRQVMGQYGPWSVNHTPQSLNVNGGILPETRNVYASYILLDPSPDTYQQVWAMPDVLIGAGIAQFEIKLFCIGRVDGRVVSGQTKFLRFGVLMDEEGNCYPSGMAETAALTNTNETVNISIDGQSMLVFQRVETFDQSGRQGVRLVMRWEGDVESVKVGMNVVAQYFSHQLFFNNPALNIAPEFLPRQQPPQWQPPQDTDIG